MITNQAWKCKKIHIKFVSVVVIELLTEIASILEMSLPSVNVFLIQ